MKKMVFLASFLGAFLLVASVALAHGGTYSGPAGAGTAGGFAPAGAGTPGPGPGPAGGATPGGAGSPGGQPGTTPGATPGGGPSRPGGSGGGTPGGGSAPGRGGATPGGGKKGKSDANNTWAAWWFFNDDRYLNIKAKVRAHETETDNADLFTGDGGVDTVTKVPAKAIRTKVNPNLQYAVKDPYYDTRAAAVIALGKCGMSDSLSHIQAVLTDEDKRVRESACLGMGILGNKDAVPILVEIMKNTSAAKKRLDRGTKDILTRTRAFAALAIGLIGTRDNDLSDTGAIPALVEMIESKDKTHRDLKVCPLIALGIMRSKESVPLLINFLNNKDENNWARAYAATALGKIGDSAAVPHLVKGLRDKQNAVAQSSAIALGILADASDKKTSAALQKMIRSGRDLAAKNFSIMGLGQIGGIVNRNFLVGRLKKGNRFEKTFSAIALAVYFEKYEDPEQIEICKMLHKDFNSVKNPDERGAFSIAMGIMKYDTAGPDILKTLKKGGQAGMRSHLCLSLGLMGYSKSISHVQSIVKERGDIDLRRNAAIALGLLGDRGAMAYLQKEMENSANSKAVHGAVAEGLGYIGDVSAVPSLVKYVRDRKQVADVTRAFAAVALGLLGDKDPLPTLSTISKNNNYLTRTDALAEVLTIL